MVDWMQRSKSRFPPIKTAASASGACRSHGVMSASGPKRTSVSASSVSAFGSKSNILEEKGTNRRRGRSLNAVEINRLAPRIRFIGSHAWSDSQAANVQCPLLGIKADIADTRDLNGRF